ncbi:GNAT family N-acetyltransferase [Planctomycetota bacterium]
MKVSKLNNSKETDAESSSIFVYEIHKQKDFPEWVDVDSLAAFLHENLKPYEDTQADIRKGIDYAMSSAEGKGGFILLVGIGQRLIGVVVMLRTGMQGYIPENVLLFIAVEPSNRGKGVGEQLVREAITRCDGDVKLHVEYDNPAKRLYERIGFGNKYAEMRYTRRKHEE